MIKKSTKSVLFLLFCLFGLSSQLDAKTVNYQFAGNENLSTDEHYCIDVQLNTSDGAELLGSGSVRLSYDESVLSFSGNSQIGEPQVGAYHSHLLDNVFVSDECNNLASESGIAPYGAHNFYGDVAGEIIFTVVLNYPSTSEVEFACPGFSDSWKSINTICFDILKPDVSPALSFMGTEKGAVLDLSGTNFNDPTNDPVDKLENGSFGDYNVPFTLFRAGAVNCGDVFLDSGGADGQYSSSERDTIIFCPIVDGEFIQVTFGEDAAVEPSTGSGSNGTGCWDYLEAFDGGSTDFPSIGAYCTGGADPSLELAGAVVTSTATDGCLTFTFFSDGSAIQDGWTADVACISEVIEGCTDPAATNYDETATIDDGSCTFEGSDCGADYVDSGGVDGDYGVNEDETVTFCPDNEGEVIQVEFTFFSSENSGTGCWDGLTIFDGPDNTFPTINTDGDATEWCWDLNDAVPSGSGDPVAGGPFLSTDDSGCLTFTFSSDGSVTRPGWEANVTCIDGNTIVFGCTDPIAENYNPDATTNDGTCEYVLGCTDMIASNYNPDATQDDGSCEFVAGCGGAYFDTGGPDGDYASNESELVTVCPENEGELAVVEFVFFSTENIGTTGCFDGLTIYDGADQTAPIITTPGGLDEWCWDLNDATPTGTGDLVANGPIVSSDASGCLTFLFESDGSVTRPGWEANITCQDANAIVFGCTDPIAENYDPNANTEDGSCEYILGCTDPTAANYDATATEDDGSCVPGCGGIFTDTGGTDGSYENNVSDETYTICPDAGTILVITFTEFQVENLGTTGCFDDLQIILGTDTDGNGGTAVAGGLGNNGGFCGDDVSDLPTDGIFTSGNFDECMTFILNSDGSVQNTGWAATVSCQTELDIEGCTDPTAVNYNPGATSDNGSCEYPPANDECVNAIPIELNAVNGPYTNVNASASEDFDEPVCWIEETFHNTVYFSFVGDGSQYSFTSIIGCDGISAEPNTDTQFLVLEGSCDGPEVACDDDGGDGFLSTVFFATQAGVTYYLLVDGFNAADGDFCIESVIAPPPANDLCEDAEEITLGDGLSYGPYSNDFATESGEIAGAGCFFNNDPFAATVYFSFVGDGNGYNLTTSNDCSDGTNDLTDTQIALYEGACDGAEINCNDDQDASLLSEMAFQTEAGVTYILVVDGFGTATGDFCLNFTEAVVGCTDPSALNYNSAATADDGSCEFPCTVFFSFVQGTIGTGFDIIGFPFPTCPLDWNGVNVAPEEVFVAVALSDDAINSPYEITTTGGSLYTSSAPPTATDPLVVNNLTIALIGLTDADLTGGIITVTYTSANNPTCTGSLEIDPATLGLASDLCPVTPIPENDECPDAIALTVGDQVINGPYTNLGATSVDDGAVTGGCFFGDDEYQSTVWFTFTGDGNEYTIQTYNCDLDNLNGDTQMSLLEGGCDGDEIECDDDSGAGLLSSITLETVAGQEYTLLVDGWNGSSGDFCIAFSSGGVPENDFCEDATEIVLDAVNGPYSNASATATDLVAAGSCWIETGLDNTVYFTFVGDGLEYTFGTSNTCSGILDANTDTQLTIHEGSCDGPEVACDDDGGPGFMSEVNFITTAGTTYYILIDGFNGNDGQFCLNAFANVIPSNDECADATPIDIFDGAVNGPLSNNNATASAEEVVTAGCFFFDDAYQATVYYSFVGDGNAYQISTGVDCDGLISPLTDTQLTLFEGECGGPELACDDDSGDGLLSQIIFTTEPGVTYYLLVDGFSGATGDYCINASQIMPPANSDCVNAISINTGDGVSNGPFTNQDALSLDETAPECFLDGSMDNTVYFTFEGDGNSYIIGSAIDCQGAFNPLTNSQMAVYEGACDGPEVAGDDISGALNLSQVALTTQVGVTYYLVVDGNGGQQGDFCINFDFAVLGCTDPFASNFNPDAVADNGTCEYIVECGGTITDPGGPLNNYANNADIAWTICPDNPEAGEVVLIQFSEFDIENNFDFVTIYDGTDVAAPVLATYTGAGIPADVFATGDSGCLTVEFTSDGSVTDVGFVATVTCTADIIPGCLDPLASNYNPDATVTIPCEYEAVVGGIFVDQGGPDEVYPGITGAPDTTVICPDNLGQTLLMTFLEFDVEVGSASGCWDQLEIYEDVDGNQMVSDADILFEGGIDTNGGFCGDVTDLPNGGVIETSTPGNCLIFVFSTDDNFGAHDGWYATIEANTVVCEATAGTIVGAGNLPSGADVALTLEGNNTSPEYINLFILTQGPEYVIESVSTTGVFPNIPDGNYCVHSFNALVAVFAEIQVAFPTGFIGVPAGDVLAALSDEACYELNPGNDPAACAALSLGASDCDLALTIFEDNCDDNTSVHEITFEVLNGSGEYNVSLNGGDPFILSSNFIFDEVSGNPQIDYVLDVTDVGTGCTASITIPIGDCAKACDAEAGELVGLPPANTYCGGEAVSVSAEGFISGGGILSQAYILSQDGTIVAVSEDGNFGNLDDGTYCIWQYNYVTEDGILPEVGTLVAVFLTDIFSFCYDLGDADGNCAEITISESPIQIEFLDECDENTNVHDITFSFTQGSGQYSVSVNGGASESLGGNPFYFTSINSGTDFSLIVTDEITGCTSSFSQLFEDCVKACDAAAGEITLTETTFCSGESVNGVSSDGFEAAIVFTQTHLLVNADGVVVGISDTGDFGSQEVGIYCVHPLNYVTENGNPLAVGDVVADALMSIDENICFDLNLDCATIAVVAAADPQPMSNSPVCAGQTIELTSADGFVSYSWVGPDGYGSDAQNPDATTPGEYTVTVTDMDGCTNSASTTVVAGSDLSIAIDPIDPAVCMGTSVSLTTDGDASLSYAWTATGGSFDDASSGAPEFTMMMPGMYEITVEVTDAFGCTGEASTVVTINPAPTEDAPDAIDVCSDGLPINLTGPDGYTYSWSQGSDDQTIEVGSAGSFDLTITDGNGCSQVLTYDVNVQVAINEPQPAPVVACDTDVPVTLTAPDGYNYLWADGSAGQSIEVSATGQYSVVISDGVCSQELTYDFTVVPSPAEPAPDPIVFCDGGAAQTLTAPDGYTYEWADGTTEQSIVVSTTGVYSVVISTGECSQTLDYNVSFNGINEVASVDLSYCSDELPATISAPAGYDYVWNDGSTGQSISITAGGVYTVTISAAGCDLLITYNVTVNEAPTVDAVTNNSQICMIDGLATLTANTTGDNVSITWSSNGGSIGSTDMPVTTFSASSPGLYTITVTVTNGFCSASDVIEINVLMASDPACTPPTGSIGDFVFFDFNENGVFDEGDQPKANATLYLYDSNNVFLGSATTDSNGNYLFDGLNAGTYTVCISLSPDQIITTAECFTVDLAQGEDYTLADFGCIPIVEGSIGGTAFVDNNGNGVYDAGDDPKSGSTISLYDSNGILITSTTTNNSGSYLFDGLEDGTYQVCTSTSSLETYTTATCYTINLGPGEDYTGADFGCQPILFGSIGDFVFYDNNGNGIFDAGDEPKINATVFLYDGNGSYLGAATTNTNGYYIFSNLSAGTYEVCLAVSPDAIVTTASCFTVNLAQGQEYLTADFGCMSVPTGQIGDFVFFDSNENGIFDAGDEPKVNATVYLYDGAGNNIATAVTNGSGNYLFGGLQPGVYQVCLAGSVDSYTTTPSCYTVDLGSSESYLTADFGCAPIADASIGDFVFYDNNGNGIFDAGDEPVGNATIYLYDENGNNIATAVTNAQGNYDFGGLDAGTYVVCIATNPNNTYTTPTCYTVELAAGQDYNLGDFGIVPDQGCEAESGEIYFVSGSSTICGGGAISVTADGFYEGGSTNHIYLLTDQNDIIVDISVNSGVFTGIPDGNYTVYSFSYNVGDFNGMPTIGQDFFASYLANSGCWDVSDGLPVVVGADLNVIVEVGEECDDDFNYPVTITVTGGSGGLLTMTGDLNGTFNTNQVIAVNILENTTYNFDIMDAAGCTEGVTIVVTNCSKTSVELVDFYGEVEAIGNELHWITATEVESKLFRVERSLNGQDFEAIGEVEAAYMSNVEIKYNLMDRNAPDGLSYYRLVEVDIYGNETLYNTITLRRNAGNGQLALYPIPAKEVLNITLDSEIDDQIELKLYDVSGKLLKSDKFVWTGSHQIDLRSFSAGTYFLTIVSSDDILSTKFVKE